VAFYSSFTDKVELVRTNSDEEVKVFNVFDLPALKEQVANAIEYLRIARDKALEIDPEGKADD
jgi:hypothetical protein